MTSTTQPRPARVPVKRRSASKILVALDTASECLSTLEMAARVAAQTQAELVALFIEDSDLIRLAGLPFACELNRSSGTERRLEPPLMARALRAQQQRVNQALVQIKQRLAVETSLRVVQGHYMSEAVTAARDVDILVLARMAGTVVRRNFVLETRHASLTLTPPAHKASKPVCVLYDGTAAGRRSLLAASRLCLHLEQPMLVLIPASHKSSFASRKQKAENLIPADVTYRTARVPPSGLSSLVTTVNQARASVFIVPRGGLRADQNDAAYPSVAEALDCCLMLVP